MSTTPPGVWARSVTGLAAVPNAAKSIAWSVHTPSVITSVSPGPAALSALLMSRAELTRNSSAAAADAATDAKAKATPPAHG